MIQPGSDAGWTYGWTYGTIPVMPALTNKLIRDAIAVAVASNKPVDLYDQAGLIVFITRAGAATFGVRYRVGKQRRRHKLGRYGDITIEQARKLAREKLGEIAKGEDPQAERVRSRQALTLTEAFTRFIAEPGKRGARKARTIDLYRQQFADHLEPKLGRTQLESIGRRETERLKVAISQSTGEAVANRVLSLLSAIFEAAQRWEEIDQGVNPCRGVARFREQGKERYLRAEERAELWRVLDEAGSARRGNPLYLGPGSVMAIRLLSLTGCRKEEIVTLTWDMVDLDASAFYLPDSKTGRKAVPLAPQAVAVLRQLEATRGSSPLVCPSEVGTEITNLGRVWVKVRKRAGLDGVRLHDLRHSAASDALNAGVPLAIVGKILGHANPRTTARYAHVSDDALRRGVEALGNAHDQAIEAGSKVTRLRRA